MLDSWPTAWPPWSSALSYADCADVTLPENIVSFACSAVTLAASGAANTGSTAAIVMLIASSPGAIVGIGGMSTDAGSQEMFSGALNMLSDISAFLPTHQSSSTSSPMSYSS